MPTPRSPPSVAGTLLLALAVGAAAAPFKPAADSQVLERLPARAADPRMAELRALRATLAANPQDVGTAVRLARRYYDEVAAEGDPRWIGYAQAALAPWWSAPSPPNEARVMRAILLQFNHHFDEAQADLDAVVAADPKDGEAWSWRAAIAMVRGDYAAARRACAALKPLASPLIGAACQAQVDGTTGQAGPAAAALRAALQSTPPATPPERLWALTRLAELEERRGEHAAAEAAFREALALDLTDGYLLAAYADFLLDRNRPREVLTLLKERTRSDLLLLRLALAAKAVGDPAAKAWSDDLGARFDAARLRGDTVHEKEEARYALGVLGDAARALPLAQRNFGVQREPADARTLLEAAVAARNPSAAEPALKWMADSRIESVVLQRLAAQLKDAK